MGMELVDGVSVRIIGQCVQGDGRLVSRGLGCAGMPINIAMGRSWAVLYAEIILGQSYSPPG